jgi:hypothetical protein
MRREWWALAALAALLRLLPGPRTIDDAFITFRYSRHLAEGQGFVYNLGEAVLGTTTPLYALLMAVLGALFGDHYPTYALIVNALADAAGVVFLAAIAHQVTGHAGLAYWLGALWAVAVFSVTFAVGGMETSLHNLWMLAAWWAYLNDRPRLLGALCALGVLTRPDALLWALPLLAHQLYRKWQTRRALPWPTWGVGLLTVAPWMLFALATFGSPIPQTVSTKAQVYQLDPLQALIALLQHYASPFQEPLLFGAPAIGLGLVLYPALHLIGLRWGAGREGRLLPILLYPWLYFVVFAGQNPLMFRWYFTPPLPAYFLGIVLGVYALTSLKPAWQGRIVAALALLTLVTSLSAWEWRPDHGPARPAPQMAFHELELHYQEMVERLQAQHGLNEESRVVAADIGAVGYYSRAYILDTIGLVTPGTLPYYQDQVALAAWRVEGQNYAIPPDLVLDWAPDYIIVMEGFIRLGLAQDPRFMARYEALEFIPTDYYGEGMLAFRKK